jgi:hypothetical protein
LSRKADARDLIQSPSVKFPHVLGIEAVGLVENAPGGKFRKGDTGDPNVGEFSDAVVLKKFGYVPEDLSEL